MQDGPAVHVHVPLEHRQAHGASVVGACTFNTTFCEVHFQSKHPAQVSPDELPVLKAASSKDSSASPQNGGLTDVHPVDPFAAVQLLNGKDLRALDRMPLCPELHAHILHQE